MPENDLHAPAASLRRLLGADAVLYWRKENDLLALAIGAAPPGLIEGGFLPPGSATGVQLLHGKAARDVLPLRIRARLDRDAGTVLAGSDGERGGILAVWFGEAPPNGQAEGIMEFALASIHSLFDAAGAYSEMQRSQARRMSGMADVLPMGVLVVPAGNRPCYVNNLAAAWLDMPAGTADASLLSDRLAGLVQRAENRDEIDARAKAFIAGQGDVPLSGQVWRFRGAPGALRVTVAPIDPQHAAGWLWLLEDVSAAEAEAEAKERQRHLEWANAELEQRVRDRTAQLEQANEVMLQTNMELQHFAHAMAHDLQTPLRSIAGFAQLVQGNVKQYGDVEVDDWASQVVSNTKRLQSLIQGLLSYARLDSRAVRVEETDMNRLFDEVVASLQAMIGETGAQVTRGQLPALPCIRTQIGQLIQNLIENGLKYNKAVPPTVSVSCRREGKSWVFSVADNGIGIDPKHHDRIFDIFKRLHTYSQVPGTGIGLALCRSIVERHGGHIWVESRPAEGSTFRFTLPDIVSIHK